MEIDSINFERMIPPGETEEQDVEGRQRGKVALSLPQGFTAASGGAPDHARRRRPCRSRRWRRSRTVPRAPWRRPGCSTSPRQRGSSAHTDRGLVPFINFVSTRVRGYRALAKRLINSVHLRHAGTGVWGPGSGATRHAPVTLTHRPGHNCVSRAGASANKASGCCSGCEGMM